MLPILFLSLIFLLIVETILLFLVVGDTKAVTMISDSVSTEKDFSNTKHKIPVTKIIVVALVFLADDRCFIIIVGFILLLLFVLDILLLCVCWWWIAELIVCSLSDFRFFFWRWFDLTNVEDSCCIPTVWCLQLRVPILYNVDAVGNFVENILNSFLTVVRRELWNWKPTFAILFSWENRILFFVFPCVGFSLRRFLYDEIHSFDVRMIDDVIFCLALHGVMMMKKWLMWTDAGIESRDPQKTELPNNDEVHTWKRRGICVVFWTRLTRFDSIRKVEDQ